MSTQTTDTTPDLTESQAAAIDRMADTSMVFHRLVRLANDAIECLALAATTYHKYAALHAANAGLDQVAAETADDNPAT